MKTPTRHALHATLIALSSFASTAADARAHGPADAVAAVVGEPAAPAAVELPLLRQGWWSGFGDAELDTLVAQARRAARTGDDTAAPRAGQLVLVLVSAREYAAHAALASERLAVLQAQRRALAAAAPTREAARLLALLDEEVERMRTGLRQHLQLRDAWLAAWSVLSGTPPTAQRVSLRPALEPAPVPVFKARAPQQPPAWAQGKDVPQQLTVLRQAQDELDGAQARLLRCERDFHAWRAQAAAQEIDPSVEAALLARYSEVLAQADLVVSARGRLALAWIQFHEVMGAE